MTTIRKVLIPHYGDPSVLQVVTTVLPPPPPHHIQIEVFYSGFGGSDISIRLGLYFMQNPAPLTPGYCLIGRIAHKGPNCTSHLNEGDIVASLTKHDAQSERVNLEEKYLIPLPKQPGLDLCAATALVLDWNTAWGMVMGTAKVGDGQVQRVFVHGISGAVGYAVFKLCQLAAVREVYGTASEKNHDVIRAQGGVPFVYSNKDWVYEMKRIGGVDAVFDPLGFESFDESYSILSENAGMLVGHGTNAQFLEGGRNARAGSMSIAKMLARNLDWRSKKRTRFYGITKESKGCEEGMRELFRLFAQGTIRPAIKEVWELDQIQEAHRSWGKARGVGSAVVRVGRGY
ncbi:chaperonin 10-like protein [Aspergillus karnatakaensis]|uniref:medium chain dehydrogenase/reductase family protein n=1 Tax=Aspergillus karnatakaensis TaxID=1810916 RepID=UPI003CCD5442